MIPYPICPVCNKALFCRDGAYHKRCEPKDSKGWAEFFIQTIKENNWSIDDIDEPLMHGWFANAQMAMHDLITPNDTTTALVKKTEELIKQISQATKNAGNSKLVFGESYCVECAGTGYWKRSMPNSPKCTTCQGSGVKP